MQRETANSLSSSLTRRSFLKTTAVASAASLVASKVYAAGSETLKVGLVGCGGRGRGAAADCTKTPGVKITALGDLFPDQMEETKKMIADRPKEQWDVPADRCFVGWDAYKKVIASDVDLVILATPPAFRPMMIEAAINAGKHVFAEKPCAVCPTGVRQVLAAGEVAAKKNLGLVVGTQRRHQRSYMETIKRIHGGAIGEVLGGQVCWMQGGAWMKPRKPEWSDTEWQLRNWPYFVWLAGDIIVEQHMHQHDIANWVMGGPPKMCIGMGGRMVRTDPAFGHIYDFFTVDFEYPNGAHIISMCRQIDDTYGRVGEVFVGTKGKAIPASTITPKDGEMWKYDGDNPNPYEMEHRDLIESIRAGKPINEAKQAAESTLTAVMGRLSAYTGKLVTWNLAMNSKLDLTPKEKDFDLKATRPLPPVALPGKEKFI